MIGHYNLYCYLVSSAGRLNVGDQLLVCDGVSLLEVTHDEAAQALKDAMDMESVSSLTFDLPPTSSLPPY